MNSDTTSNNLVESRPEAFKESSGRNGVAGSPAHVLVVDDDPESRAMLEVALGREYAVRTATDGAEAMSAVGEEIPDIIISDVMMPNADGYDLLDFLRSDPSTRDLPVILLSGRAESEERTKGLEKGARDYIAKPLDSRELMARVKIHLQLAQSRRAAETQIKQLTDRVVSAQDKERKRIARDLHDQIGQQLTALRLQLELLRGISREANLVERIAETQTIANQLDSDIDFLTWELHSTALECVDIVGALANYVSQWSRRFGVLADFQILHLDQNHLKGDAKTNIYRIVQESLHNIAKHAKATQASVVIEAKDGVLELSVTDNGVGFDTSRLESVEMNGTGIGMAGMRERAAMLDGQLFVESTPGEGTRVKLRMPLDRAGSRAA